MQIIKKHIIPPHKQLNNTIPNRSLKKIEILELGKQRCNINNINKYKIKKYNKYVLNKQISLINILKKTKI